MKFVLALVCVTLVALSWVDAHTVDCSDPNASYPSNGCGTSCPSTCENRGSVYCIDQCVETCNCNRGYLLDTESGLCVLEDECPRW